MSVQQILAVSAGAFSGIAIGAKISGVPPFSYPTFILTGLSITGSIIVAYLDLGLSSSAGVTMAIGGTLGTFAVAEYLRRR